MQSRVLGQPQKLISRMGDPVSWVKGRSVPSLLGDPVSWTAVGLGGCRHRRLQTRVSGDSGRRRFNCRMRRAATYSQFWAFLGLFAYPTSRG